VKAADHASALFRFSLCCFSSLSLSHPCCLEHSYCLEGGLNCGYSVACSVAFSASCLHCIGVNTGLTYLQKLPKISRLYLLLNIHHKGLSMEMFIFNLRTHNTMKQTCFTKTLKHELCTEGKVQVPRLTPMPVVCCHLISVYNKELWAEIMQPIYLCSRFVDAKFFLRVYYVSILYMLNLTDTASAFCNLGMFVLTVFYTYM
jgi:hypothetical protein